MEFFVTKGFDRKKKNESQSNCKVIFCGSQKKGRNELKRRTDKPITQIQLDVRITLGHTFQEFVEKKKQCLDSFVSHFNT